MTTDALSSATSPLALIAAEHAVVESSELFLTQAANTSAPHPAADSTIAEDAASPAQDRSTLTGTGAGKATLVHSGRQSAAEDTHEPGVPHTGNDTLPVHASEEHGAVNTSTDGTDAPGVAVAHTEVFIAKPQHDESPPPMQPASERLSALRGDEFEHPTSTHASVRSSPAVSVTDSFATAYATPQLQQLSPLLSLLPQAAHHASVEGKVHNELASGPTAPPSALADLPFEGTASIPPSPSVENARGTHQELAEPVVLATQRSTSIISASSGNDDAPFEDVLSVEGDPMLALLRPRTESLASLDATEDDLEDDDEVQYAWEQAQGPQKMRMMVTRRHELLDEELISNTAARREWFRLHRVLGEAGGGFSRQPSIGIESSASMEGLEVPLRSKPSQSRAQALYPQATPQGSVLEEMVVHSRHLAVYPDASHLRTSTELPDFATRNKDYDGGVEGTQFARKTSSEMPSPPRDFAGPTKSGGSIATNEGDEETQTIEDGKDGGPVDDGVDSEQAPVSAAGNAAKKKRRRRRKR
jgi:hypothetical protein